MSNEIFNIFGRVIEHSRKQGIAGLNVEAWDKDLLFDDALGRTVTDANGFFTVTFNKSFFQELFFDKKPDIYFLIYVNNQLIKSTKDSVLWNVESHNTKVLIELNENPFPPKKEQTAFIHPQNENYMKENLIKRAASLRRADALFKAMSTDFLLREQFITDPAQIMSEYVHGKNLTPENSAVSNQMLYSVMSNPGLLHWLRNYSLKMNGSLPSPEKFINDFSRAAVDNKAYHVILALARSSNEKETIYGLEEVLVPLIFHIFSRGGIFSSGTEMSTGTYATEQSGTHISGGIFESGTEMSTGTFATEQSGTHISGGIFESGTEMSTGTFATEQSGTHISGGIFESGTEMSTGTGGTEMSTGTGGTEKSTGNATDFLNSRYILVSLEALARYSTQLRNIGALNTVYTRFS